MVDVTYTPQDPADPSMTEWQGFTFEANKAVTVPDNHALLSLVEGNPYFSLAGGRKGRKRASGELTTPEEYMRYAVDWINGSTNSGAMISRWDNEEPMRSSVGWGSDDDDKIAQIYQPKLEALKKAEREVAG